MGEVFLNVSITEIQIYLCLYLKFKNLMSELLNRTVTIIRNNPFADSEITVFVGANLIFMLGIVSKGRLRQQATQKTRTGKRIIHLKYL